VSVGIAAVAILAGVAAVVLSDPVASQSSNGQRAGAAAATKPQSTLPASKTTAQAPGPQLQSAGKGGEEAAPIAAREKEREDKPALDQHLADATAAIASQGLALTYATIGLMVVAASLWLMTFLQSRDLKAAVRAVREASDAAQRSTQFMERAVTLTQRATIIVGEPRAVWLRDAEERLVGCRLLVTWHNVGTTPTRNMIAAVAGLATDKPPPQTSAFPSVNARQQPAAVGPNAALNSAYVNLPIGLVADILARKAHYLFAGWAEYNDVFDRTPRHRVEFCYQVEFEGDPDAQRLEARFHIHGKHNRHCEAEAEAERQIAPDGSNGAIRGGLSAAESVGAAAAPPA
jgi:hypothetical protein